MNFFGKKLDNSERTGSFYSHLEYLKNTLYREVSGSRVGGIFWPSYYYYWFYSPEKTKYTALVNRQKLGRFISNEEVQQYNTIRAELKPTSRYIIKKRRVKTLEGARFDFVTLGRTTHYLPQCFAVGLFAHFYLQLSRYWLGFCFLPAFAIWFYDVKFSPIDEINNFYDFVQQKRNCDELFNEHKKSISSKLESSPEFKKVVMELTNTGKSLEEAMSDIYTSYIVAAENELSFNSKK
jgi:hypothetical protein